MGQVLHGSARTTEAVRRAIHNSQESLRALSKRYGINQKTVAKWKKRTAVAAYHRLRAADAARPYNPGKVASAESVLIATRASSPAGIGAKLIELAAHQGWFAKPDHYQTRIIHSALADLKGLEGRAS